MRRSASRCGRSGPVSVAADSCQCDTEVEASMAVADGVELAGQRELLGGVLADRLEQLVEARWPLLQRGVTSPRAGP